ncbi:MULTISPECIES: ABC transporter ATP-binding protein [Enterococcus]|nr:ATP-binding cassette domain-containing protein [Enterococcus avium]HAP3021184.1 ATP-binding cassette domain-containing protein [Enterococcus faecalis]AYQ24238.1 ABC transporter ATP-binding protein [Enterococcus avium]HBI1562012.1 ATP-binding cassette domain-containing protein [Enterococcus faecalis]HBI1565071.1 ATP-binding cassette domain-containing protein [Enterococcus faecalis]HBI1717381.1 ATP-binding cassette domain-containing protein [Enterococcus faecalis]
MSDIICVNDLIKEYAGIKVVDGVSFSLNKGEIYGLLGRNGAGKTTIMKILLGLANPTSGKVSILGKDMSVNSEKKVLKKVGCIIENPGFYSNLTGTENLEIFAKLRGLDQDSVKKTLDLVNLPYKDKKLFSKYSLGMKQRLAIANAIMHNPEILVLDEPINGLDPIGIAEVRELLKKLKESGVSILISSHILSELENLADRIGIIDFGKMIEEINMKEWKNKQNSDIRVFVKEVDIAKNILFDIGVEEQNILEFSEGVLIKNSQLSTTELNKVFVNSNIDLIGIVEDKTSLEDYFKKVTGGQGIG